MTLTNQQTRVETAGAGAIVNADFTFPVTDESEIAVYLTDDDPDVAPVLLTITTDYTVALAAGGTEGGTVTTVATVASGDYIVVELNRPKTQSQSYGYAQVFPSGATEAGLDKLTSLMLRAFSDIGRTVKLDAGGVISNDAAFKAQNLRIADLGDPDNAQDAATKAYVLSEIANAVLSGTIVTTPFTAGLLAEASAAAVLTYLGFSSYAQTLRTATTLSAHLTSMGISSDVRALLAAGNDSAFMTALGFSDLTKTLVAYATTSDWRSELGIDADDNRIINGDFQNWQEQEPFQGGTTIPNNDDTPIADGWYLLSNGNDQADVSRITADLPAACRAGIRLDPVNASTKFGLVQFLENRDAAQMGGETVSVGFWARCKSSGTLTGVRSSLYSWSGTADAPTTDIVSAWNGVTVAPTPIANYTLEESSLIALTSTWQYFSFTTSSTIAASPNNLALAFWTEDAGWNAGDWIEISGVWCGIGSTAGRFSGETPEISLLRCNRFYAKTFPKDVDPADNAGNAGIIVGRGHEATTGRPTYHWRYRQSMIAAPTVSFYNPSGGTAGYWDNISGGGAAELQANSVYGDAHGVFISATAGGGSTGVYGVHAVADARF